MKRFLPIISLLLIVLLTVETIGFSTISYCCGAFDLVTPLTEPELCCATHQHQHPQAHTSGHAFEECPHIHVRWEGGDYVLPCVDMEHHHDHQCVRYDLYQFRPEKQPDLFTNFLSFLPIVVELFDFQATGADPDEPAPSFPYLPCESGREILTQHAVYRI